MSFRIRLLGALKARWEQVNPILKKNELVIEEDTSRLKIGDGVSTYTDLPYINTGAGGSVAVINNLTSSSTIDALSANQGRILQTNKVDKVSGKGLSTNDYTDLEKQKLNDLQNIQIRNNFFGEEDAEDIALSSRMGYLLHKDKLQRKLEPTDFFLDDEYILSVGTISFKALRLVVNQMTSADVIAQSYNENANPYMPHVPYRSITEAEIATFKTIRGLLPEVFSELVDRIILPSEGTTNRVYDLHTNTVITVADYDFGDVIILVREFPFKPNLEEELIDALYKLKFGFEIDCGTI